MWHEPMPAIWFLSISATLAYILLIKSCKESKPNKFWDWFTGKHW
jgi:hypothetical protein